MSGQKRPVSAVDGTQEGEDRTRDDEGASSAKRPRACAQSQVAPSSSLSSSTAEEATEGVLAELIDQGKQHVAQLAPQIRAINTAACAAVQYRRSCWPRPADPVKEAAHEAAVRAAAAGLSVDVVWFACQRVQIDEEALQRTLSKLASASSEDEKMRWRPSPVSATWVRGQWEDLFLGMTKQLDEMPGRFLVADWTDEGQLFQFCSRASHTSSLLLSDR
jgi:hypothetical protein